MTGRLAAVDWRELVRRDGDHPVQPFLLAGVLLAAVTAATVASPESVRGPVAAGAAAAVLIVGYVAWPKPALVVLALFALLSRLLGHWLTTDLARVDDICVPVFALIALWRLRPWRRELIRPIRDGALLAFFGIGLVSSLVAAVPPAVLLAGLFPLLKVFAFLYIVTWHDFSARDVRQLGPLVVFVAVLILAVGALEAIDPAIARQTLNLGPVGNARAGLPSIKSLLWHPGTFAFFTTFVALFMFAGYVVFRRWWLLIAGVLFGAATILAGRRRALGALAAGVVTGFIASLGRISTVPGSFRAWLPVAAGMGVLIVAFLPSLFGLARSTVDDVTDSGTARVALYGASVEIARDHFPIGVGFGRFGSKASKAPYSPVYAQYGLDQIRGLGPGTAEPNYAGDAFWARVVGETGVLGTAALVLFVAALAAEVWRAARARYDAPLATAFTLGASMIMAQAVVETLASPMFDAPTRVYLVFGAVGMALSMRRTSAP